MPDAYVQAKAGAPERVVAQAQTDSQGRYVLEGAPAGRVTLAVEATGFYTVKAGSLDSETLVQNCPEAGDCGTVDFVVARTSVLEGWLADDFGEPVDAVMVTLTPAMAGEPAAGSRPGRRRAAHRGWSDDRGYFRLWGVKPGRYELKADTQRFVFPRWRPRYETSTREVEIAGGGVTEQARMALKGDAEVYSIAGEVEGLPEDAGFRSFSIQPKVSADPNAQWFQMFTTIREGKFQVGGLKKGEYVAYLVEGNPPDRKTLVLGDLMVDKNLTDLRLRPGKPTGVRGRVVFEDAEEGNVSFEVRWAGDGVGPFGRLRAEGPDYTFQYTGLLPGEYSIRATSREYFLLEEPTLVVGADTVTELDLTVSSAFAQVRGTVRTEGDGPRRKAAAQFLVAMRGDRGSHRSQADDSGAFLFDKVIPGEYQVAAWNDPSTDVNDEAAWDERRTTVRTITVEAGFEMDVSLTVKP